MEFLFEFERVTPEMRVASMRTMKPTTGFGETFQYSNTMVSTGGYVAAHAVLPEQSLGTAYDETMRTRVFTPLGMNATTFDFETARAADHALPHSVNLKLETAPIDLEVEHALIPVRPAGGAWSSTRDLARYVLMELSRGTGPRGERFVSEENLLRRREPQVKVTDEVSYGLGLFIQKDKGVAVVSHGGNTLGFTSDLFFLPEHGVGAVVLTNAGNANAFRNAVRRKLMEVLFDGKDEAKENLAFALAQREKVMARECEEISFDPDPAWLEQFAGLYRNDALGTIDLRVDSGKGVLDAEEWRSSLGRRLAADGTETLILTGAPLAGLELLPSADGAGRKLTLQLAQQEYAFERVR
jgi:CubicO group peptidase (beta-lactamase class C family)